MEFLPLEIIFYDGTGSWATLIDRIIRLRSDYTHVEAKFPDGMSFSSSIRRDLSGKNEGVRLKKIGYSHPGRWHVVVLWVTRDELNKMRLAAELMHQLKIKYDLRAIPGFLITGRHNPRAYFCSEVIYALLAMCFLFPDMNFKMHPDDLEIIVTKLAALLAVRKKVLGVS